MYLRIKVLFFFLFLVVQYPLQAELVSSGPADLVIYAQGFAVVREPLTLRLSRGRNQVIIDDFPLGIQPESLILHTDDTPFQIIKQKFIQSVNQQMVLDHYEGEIISFEIVCSDSGERWVRPGKIIRSRDPIVKLDGKLRFGLPGQPLFSSLIDSAPLKPVFSLDIDSRLNTTRDLDLSYISGGLSWQANYNAIIREDSLELDLGGWFLIQNNTNKSFLDAEIKLLAGDIQRSQPQPQRGGYLLAEASFDRAAPGLGRPQVAPIDDYYLYSIPDTLSINKNELTQVEFISASGVKINRRYDFYGANSENAQIFIEFDNSKENNLGKPLPGGQVSLYRVDSGSIIFIGQDQITHKPEAAEIELNIGSAFDIVGQRKQMELKRVSSRQEEESYQIEIKNHRDEAIELNVIETMRRRDWEIIEASQSFERVDAQTAKFIVNIPAKQEAKITYTVRLRW